MKELKEQFYNEGFATTFYLKPKNKINKIKNKILRKILNNLLTITYTIFMIILAIIFYKIN